MSKQVFSVRLPEEVLREIEKISIEEDRPRGGVIRRLLIRGLINMEEKNESESYREGDRPGNGADSGVGL